MTPCNSLACLDPYQPAPSLQSFDSASFSSACLLGVIRIPVRVRICWMAGTIVSVASMLHPGERLACIPLHIPGLD